ncbi:MAG: hypothetical protein QY321_03445 [Patescibacteria group bacterium]|nr:MAG: hypothetical protein QY321_03445 [Patescibacteria group bacterium]
MQINWRIWVPVLIALLIIASFLIVKYSQEEEIVSDQRPAFLEEPSDTAYSFEEDNVPVSGDVDDATESILIEASDDEVFFSESSSDADLIFNDSQLINDINQSYDENDF